MLVIHQRRKFPHPMLTTVARQPSFPSGPRLLYAAAASNPEISCTLIPASNAPFLLYFQLYATNVFSALTPVSTPQLLIILLQFEAVPIFSSCPMEAASIRDALLNRSDILNILQSISNFHACVHCRPSPLFSIASKFVFRPPPCHPHLTLPNVRPLIAGRSMVGYRPIL